jgi:hypothetical protein
MVFYHRHKSELEAPSTNAMYTYTGIGIYILSTAFSRGKTVFKRAHKIGGSGLGRPMQGYLSVAQFKYLGICRLWAASRAFPPRPRAEYNENDYGKLVQYCSSVRPVIQLWRRTKIACERT